MKMKLKPAAAMLLILTLFFFPAEAFAAEKEGTIVSAGDTKYSYMDMRADLRAMAEKYPEYTKLEILGTTADNRNIYCLRIGNHDAKRQIIVQAGIHAREWLNCQVLMKAANRYLVNYKTGKYQNKTYKEIFGKTAVYIVPMVNPDGVSISQYGIGQIRDKALRGKLKKMRRKGSYKSWKANARGVDLNRNFPACWGRKKDYRTPGSEGYPGKYAKSERETQAVLKLINRLPNLKACINYHSKGQLIYWGAKGTGAARKNACNLAKMIKNTTGYRMVDETKSYGAGGDLERYLIATKKLPYVCIETGTGAAPLAHSKFYSIYNKNKDVIVKAAWMYRGK